MPCAFQLLANLADGCGKESTTTITAAPAEGAAAEAEALTTAAPRRRRDTQVSIGRKVRHKVLTVGKNPRRREIFQLKKVEIIKAGEKRER
jgi:hypothetical protein